MTFYHDIASNMLVYDLPEPDKVMPHVVDGLRLHNGYCAIPGNLYNLQILRHFGLPVIPIVDLDYDYPIARPFRPREHQKIMTNFMVLHPRCFNLSDMGTMKTLAALWACDYVMQQHEKEVMPNARPDTGLQPGSATRSHETTPGGPPRLRALISCPLSIMQRVWGDAIFQHLVGRRTFTIIHGSAAKRRDLLRQDTDFYIINHDGAGIGARFNKQNRIELNGLSKDISERTDIGIVAIDEASAYRDGTTRRHRVARAVFGQKPYFWLLTGTPTANGPLDAHGLARLVNGAMGESFRNYKSRIMYQAGPWKWEPKRGAHEEAYKLLRPSIRFEMRDCTDVPPSTEQMRDVELSGEQKKLYKKLQEDLVLMLDNGKVITAAHEAVLRLKLLQLSCGAIYDSDHHVTKIDCGPRLAELRAVIEEASRKVIIFTPLTSVVHLLYDELKEYSRAMINGAVPPKVRDAIFQRFQADRDPQLLIADPATMSHGLDLFAASVVVWYGATDRTELYLQANRRIDRPGQTVPTTIVQLAATKVEREIFKRAASNQSMMGAILEMVR